MLLLRQHFHFSTLTECQQGGVLFKKIVDILVSKHVEQEIGKRAE